MGEGKGVEWLFKRIAKVRTAMMRHFFGGLDVYLPIP